MNHLKATIIRKKYIQAAEEEKLASAKKIPSKKVRPGSSIKSINEVPSAYDLRYENPPLCIYERPSMKQDMSVKKHHLSK